MIPCRRSCTVRAPCDPWHPVQRPSLQKMPGSKYHFLSRQRRRCEGVVAAKDVCRHSDHFPTPREHNRKQRTKRTTARNRRHMLLDQPLSGTVAPIVQSRNVLFMFSNERYIDVRSDWVILPHHRSKRAPRRWVMSLRSTTIPETLMTLRITTRFLSATGTTLYPHR